MDRLVPRHRRKAGSGPPASALIAWVGADPYLREAAATVSDRRAMTLPLPSHTRAAKAAIAACFVLTCGAVLGITTIISHGRNAALYESSTPSPRQGGAEAPAPDAPPIVRVEAESDPVPAAVPVEVAPASAKRAPSRPSTGALADQRVNQVAGKQPGTSRDNVRAGAITTSIPAATPTGEQRHPDTAADPVTPEDIDTPADAPAKPSGANAGKPVDAGTPPGAGKLTHPSTRSNPDKTTDSTKSAGPDRRSAVPDRRAARAMGGGPSQRSAGRSPADVVHERLARAHDLLEKHVGAAAPPR